MDLSSWFRRTLLKVPEKTKTPDAPEQSNQNRSQNEPEEELLGVTQELIDHIKSFTLDTFKHFPLPDDEGADSALTTSSNTQRDLSEWQERHATLVLSKVKELSYLRYKLCPGYLKEHQFWRVYFKLVKNQVAEYELRAIQVTRLKEMARENEKPTNGSACEVEMAEAKEGASFAPPTP